MEYTYMFDPKNPTAKAVPPDADAARRLLEEGNRLFSQWMERCRMKTLREGEPECVMPCNGLEMGMPRTHGEMPKPSPFAVVVGCSDARVPAEMLFGQRFNDLFVIRVAGHLAGESCMESVEYALDALSESVRVVVVLGHSGCGAVSGGVDAYLRPLKLWSHSTSSMLRALNRKILVAVREAANGLNEVWGPTAREAPGYREALIESAVGINTAQAAFELRREMDRAGKWEIEVLYGVHNIRNHQVCMPVDPGAARRDENVRLAQALRDPKEFRALAVRMAEILKPPDAMRKELSLPRIQANGACPPPEGNARRRNGDSFA
jgi:carbonic anhydrase